MLKPTITVFQKYCVFKVSSLSVTTADMQSSAVTGSRKLYSDLQQKDRCDKNPFSILFRLHSLVSHITLEIKQAMDLV